MNWKEWVVGDDLLIINFCFVVFNNSFALKIFSWKTGNNQLSLNKRLLHSYLVIVTEYLLLKGCLHHRERWWGDKKSMIWFWICSTKGFFFSKVQTAKLALRRLKTLRHPNIVRYIDALEVRIKEMLPLMALS